MSKSVSNTSKKPISFVKELNGIKEYVLQNGLTVLYYNIKDTGVVTTNITYNVGARDELTGQTGIAHMLEHMLFKPTRFDKKRKIDSGAMQFERETGCILNANTWKDRTTYFFSYPKQYFSRALQIEAERMHGVLLTEEEFEPERGNVLSEFDMYFGDPYFALSVEMVTSAFHSHPYGHETIGFREDIERYTTDLLEEFYTKYYDPSNATLMIIGDIEEKEALEICVAQFGLLKTNGTVKRNTTAVEPKQEGLRRVTIERESNTNIVAFGVKHQGFPKKEWYLTSLLSTILTDGQDSVLYKKLIDTGLASKVEMVVEPTSEANVAILYVTLSKKATHAQIEKIVAETIAGLTKENIALDFKKAQQRILTDEILSRSDSSLKIAMELTEYVSARAWPAFFETESILNSIKPKDIVQTAVTLFTQSQMTIGHFVGKQ